MNHVMGGDSIVIATHLCKSKLKFKLIQGCLAKQHWQNFILPKSGEKHFLKDLNPEGDCHDTAPLD